MASRLTKSKRFNEIFHILVEHRLTSLAKDLSAYARRRAIDRADPNAPKSDLPERTRRLLEDLGPTFIKIGQLLGTRPDLIPKEFVEEYKKMYDQTTPTPFPEIRRLVESQLGKPLAKVFKTFDEDPIASASMAQVHRATLTNGDVVAVKVQHPGIEERMRLDFELLKTIIAFTEKVFAATHVWQPLKHLEEIRHMLDKELDFRNELKVQQTFEENFKDVPEVKIPHSYPELSTRRVLVMEFITGAKFRQRGRLNLAKADEKFLARVITEAMAKQIFLDRVFHADPSPGNILILGKRQVCFLDFGAVGSVTRRRAKHMFDFITSLGSGNLDETARVILEMCEVRREYDTKQFLFDIERIIDYYEVEHATPADPVLLDKIVTLANTHGLLLPADFMLITRSLYQFEGMCHELDPDFDLVSVIEPFVQKTLRERLLSADVRTEQLAAVVADLAKFAARLPAQVDRILTKVEKGQFTSRIELVGLDEYKRHTSLLHYVLGFTILLAAAILATAWSYTVGGVAALRLTGFIATLLVLVWCLVVIINHQNTSRRR